MIALFEKFSLLLGNGYFIIRDLIFFGSFFFFCYLIVISEKLVVLIVNGESVGTHGCETLRKFLFHRIDGGIDTHQGHDAECNNGYRDTSPEFIAPDCTE